MFEQIFLDPSNFSWLDSIFRGSPKSSYHGKIKTFIDFFLWTIRGQQGTMDQYYNSILAELNY